ncbi:PREDICTED: uncharacterized protein LOC101297050 [Fragaria vesca subsp. vesca]|uniref:uncharacterized protein LOC101297050 n=1 Tax=Fragaria vesca subsp. vesca TaxID=101020 RepID=UPI0002C313F5|nr:PREDICTED: uncharacterized protein LOC101297050 [Fragaria vesca subsp. vesca]
MPRCQNQRSLDKLRLRVVHSLAGDDKDTIDKCVTFALERFVKELELCFLGAENEVSFYQVPQAVFSSHFLVSLNLEKVKIDFITRDRVNDPLTLLSLRTMSLKEVEIDDIDLEILLKGKYVPRLEHLELNLCDLGDQADEPRSLRMWDSSLKSLEIIDCHQYVFEVVECVNLETFKFISDCSCARHVVLTVWQCDNLKHLYIYSVGLKRFHLLGCPTSMESAIFTPSLVYFLFSGVVETKVHFLESPPGLIDAEFRIQNYRWTSEYYSLLRERLEIFDCTGILERDIHDAKGIIIPENCRREWSPPLPRVKQLQLTFLPLPDGDYQLDDLDPSLTWIAPSAEILPHRYNSSVGQL